MHSFQKYLPDHWNEWITTFSLSKSNGKNKSLSGHDFSQDIKLEFIDGSTAFFFGAFAVKYEEKEEIAVFTEHCGYLVFNMHAIEGLSGKLLVWSFNV